MKISDLIDAETDLFTPSETMVLNFQMAMRKTGLEKHVTVVIDSDAPKSAYITLIVTNRLSRRRGYASKALSLLTALADKYNVTLTLDKDAADDENDGALTTDMLSSWYERQGFNSISDIEMRRSPNASRNT